MKNLYIRFKSGMQMRGHHLLSRFLFTLLFVLLAGMSYAQSPTLLFKSGFEDGVYIKGPYATGNPKLWRADILGADAGGSKWPATLWGAHQAYQFMNSNRYSLDGDEQHIEFQTVTGHGGAQTRALYLYQTAAADKGAMHNEQYVEGIDEQPSMYLRWWVKLDDEISAKTAANSRYWRTVFQFKTSGDYRIAAYIYRDDSTGKPYWHVHADNIANGGSPPDGIKHTYWRYNNKTVPVTEGQWALMEIYWERNPSTYNGRFFWSVDGQTIANHVYTDGQIAKDGSMYGYYHKSISRIMLFDLYTDKEARPSWQWVDDFEAWDKPPCGSLPCGK